MFGFMSFLKVILIFFMFLFAILFTIDALLHLSKKKKDKWRDEGVRHPLVRILILLVCGIALGWLAFYWAFHDEYSAFRPYLTNYADLRSTAPGVLLDSESLGYVRGKAILLDRVAGGDKRLSFDSAPSGFTSNYTIVDSDISVLQQELPNKLAAKQPEDVGTVVWLIWDKKTIHYYTGDARAYQVLCTVEIYDNQKRKHVQSKVFEGEVPPKYLKVGGSFNGRPPSKDIIAYICNQRRIGLTE
jgi:hypothetical protein